MLAVRLGATPIVDSIVICHPGSITIEQIKAIKVLHSVLSSQSTPLIYIVKAPAAWACAEGPVPNNNYVARTNSAYTIRQINQYARRMPSF